VHEGIIHGVIGSTTAISFRRRRAAACLALALVAIPCNTRSAVHAQADAPPRFEALVSLTEARMKEHGVPGVALGIVADGVTSIRGLGVTNVEDPLPITEHTVFPIASISKTFAATAMMRLVEQGKVDLRAPVRTYLPEFRVRDEAASRDVTVWHLLTHLGGWEGQVSGPDRGSETLKNFVATITDLMQVAPPGKAWSYNNAGFSIAGRVIEVVTGTSINQAIRDLVFRPLGLEHAGTTTGEFIVQRFAAGHTTRDGKTTLQRPFSPSTSVTAGGVGLCMTDLIAFARFHMGDGTAANGERVLKRESLEQMRTVQAHKQGTDDDIGLAWHIRQVGTVRTYGHGGTLGGHILLLEIVPERRFAIAILTNANTGWRLIQDVEREALKSYLGAIYAPNQAIAHRGLVETLPSVQPLAPQPDPAPYLGTYTRPGNSYVVRAEGGKLFVQDRPNGAGTPRESPVAFYGSDRLVVTDGPDRGQSIEFVRDDAGRVNWIRVVGRVAVRAASPQSGAAVPGRLTVEDTHRSRHTRTADSK
jgi:CubicO group peptidase (beta-lactamase class C family)